MRQAKFRFVLLPLLFLVAGVFAFAQANSELTGIVTDASGAVVASAKVALADPATGAIKVTESSSTGLYNIGGLNPATYTLKVTAKGFETFVQTGVVVNVSATVPLDVRLTVGAESETVTVQADALAVQADSNVVSTLINEQQITELATNGRNLVGLASLGLGVSSNLPDTNMPTSVGANFNISFNGLRESHNIWLIDGGEADDRGGAGGMSIMPSQDALNEFQVLASNYPPDYGISSGGTVTMAIKNGTRTFHGELFEFDRNDALQAHNYFDNNNGQDAKKPELRMNIFGANLGGPVFIPGVYNTTKEKTFFFYNEEWRRIIQGASPTSTNAIPTADFISAPQDLAYVVPKFASKNESQIFVPSVGDAAFNAKLQAAGLTPGQAFPGNVIPGSLMDANSLAYLGTKVIPQATSSANDSVSPSTPLPTMVREDLFRVDHKINDKWQIMGHYIHDAVSQTYATSMWSGDSYQTVGSSFTNPSYSSVVKLTGTLTPNTLLEASMNYDGNIINIIPTGIYKQPSGWGVSRYFQGNNADTRLPSVKLNSWGTQVEFGSWPWHNAAQDFDPKVDLSVTAGKHAFKFGAGYNRYTKNQQIFGNTEGYYTFDDNVDSSGNPTTVGLTGDSYVDFLLGLSTNYAELQNQDTRHYVNQTLSAYINDNWHASPRLSLQLGFRYDALPHAWERANRVANFDPSLYQTALMPVFNADGSIDLAGPGVQQINGQAFYTNGLALAGQNGVPRGMVNNDFKTYQPRVGFSYDLTGNGQTVLRGGFGTFFERMQGNDIYNVAPNPPFAYTPSANNVEFTNPHTTWKTGDTAATPFFPSGLTNLATYYPAPAVAQFSLGVQRQLAPSVIAVVQYVGNMAWHQNVERPVNNFPLSTDLPTRQQAGANKLNKNLYRTYLGYDAITQQENTTNGNYNGFQAGVRLQNKWNLSGEFDYTYSHEIDVSSFDLKTVSNPWNLKYDKGSGELDRRHILNMNYVYKIPLFAHASGFQHSVLGGWELSGAIISETGLPSAGPGEGTNIGCGGCGGDTIGLGGGYTNRPNMSGKPHYVKHNVSGLGYQWFDASGLSAPVAAWNNGPYLGFGNLGKDKFVWPGRTNFTTSLYKSFAFTERTHFELRAESFNTFNHTQFNSLHSGDHTASNFGVVTNANDPRTFELGDKFIF